MWSERSAVFQKKKKKEKKLTWTLAPVTMLGLSVGKPRAFLLFCHLLLNARPASMMASEDPTVPTPTATSESPSGALNKLAIMFTHLFCFPKYSDKQI